MTLPTLPQINEANSVLALKSNIPPFLTAIFGPYLHQPALDFRSPPMYYMLIWRKVAQTMLDNPPILPFLRAISDGVLLSVKLQPRASSNEIGKSLGNELRVKVTAPPVDAAVNEALLRLLIETLDCPCGNVELLRGHTSRHKLVKIRNLDPIFIVAKLFPPK